MLDPTLLRGQLAETAARLQATRGFAPPLTPVAFRAAVGIDADVRAIQPRITYLDNSRLFGANIGFTMMLPIVQRHADFTLTAPDLGLGAPIQALVQAGLNTQAAALSRPATGIGDFEMGGILHWELADNQALTLVSTFVVPSISSRSLKTL